MKRIEIPLLTNEDGTSFPKDGKCPLCGTAFKDARGVAYISGGALVIDKASGDSIDPSTMGLLKLEAFLGIGFHSGDAEVRDSVHADIVDDLLSDQFEISFCSFQCLKSWLNQLLDGLQSELTDKQRKLARTDNAE
jgi:hypothetical protein